VEGSTEEGSSVEVEEVEGEEDRRRSRSAGDAGSASEARRQAVGVEPAGAVDDDDLAVEDGRAGGELIADRAELGEVGDPVDAVGVEEGEGVGRARGVGAGDEGEDPEPTPERLEDVVRGVEGGGEGARQHRPQTPREVRRLGRQLEGKLVGHPSRW
jgi:hypothetical protein